MAIERCPKDGQTLGWHLFAVNTDFNGKIVTNGDVARCDFGKQKKEASRGDGGRLEKCT